MTDDERQRIQAEATDRADTKNRLANLESKMKAVLAVAYGAGAWFGVKILEWLSTRGGPN